MIRIWVHDSTTVRIQIQVYKTNFNIENRSFKTFRRFFFQTFLMKTIQKSCEQQLIIVKNKLNKKKKIIFSGKIQPYFQIRTYSFSNAGSSSAKNECGSETLPTGTGTGTILSKYQQILCRKVRQSIWIQIQQCCESETFIYGSGSLRNRLLLCGSARIRIRLNISYRIKIQILYFCCSIKLFHLKWCLLYSIFSKRPNLQWSFRIRLCHFGWCGSYWLGNYGNLSESR